MVFFSGWGIVMPVFGLLGALVGAFASQTLHIQGDNGATGMIIAGCVAAGLCWSCGSALNDPAKDRLVIDKRTGEEIRLKTRHTFMFIPLQFWAVAYLALAALSVSNIP